MEIVRSPRRKTMGIEVKRDGTVIVRVPSFVPNEEIYSFIKKHQKWIEDKQKKALSRQKEGEPEDKMSMDEINELAKKALEYIPERVKLYAEKGGITYKGITIRNQRTRWGSCSSKGNLNFNCLLMLTPPEVIDSVVVHELCHRKEMNQSQRFYAEVLKLYPEYHKWNDWLKKNGPGIMRRMTG